MPLLIAGCSLTGDCDSSELEEVRSPDGAWVAASYHWDCGATTRTAQLISVRPADRRFEEGDLKTVVFSSDWEGKLHLTWKDARTLLIEHDAPARNIFIHESTLKSVSVEYLRKGPR